MNANPLFFTRTPILSEGKQEGKRKEILDYFHKTFDLDEQLFEAYGLTAGHVVKTCRELLK